MKREASSACKPFKPGEVVFVAGDSGEYQTVVEVRGDEVVTFNPRWGGDEVSPIREVRKLTKKERGK